jgi:parvulin-like peptidyl-prolyl isomerase
MWRDRVAPWLREPLVHFLIAGAVVFLVLSGRPPDPGDRRIVVDEATAVRLADRFAQTYRRAPAPDEIDSLIRDYVKDEVYYREALRLELDKGDEVVVRRMRNKMLSLATADAEAREPGDAELQALIDKDPARYAKEAKYTLAQVYFGQDNPASRQAAEAALAQLRAGKPAAGLGAPAPLPQQINAQSASEVAGQFGDGFVEALAALPIGQWGGPVVSGLGLHLVKVAKREASTPPRLADIRQRLANDWRAAEIKKAEEENYRELLEGYDVVIAKPGP